MSEEQAVYDATQDRLDAEYTATEPTLAEQVATLRGSQEKHQSLDFLVHDQIRDRLTALEGIVRESYIEAKFSELFAGLDAHMSRIERIEQRMADGDLTAPLSGSLALALLERLADAAERQAAALERIAAMGEDGWFERLLKMGDF